MTRSRRWRRVLSLVPVAAALLALATTLTYEAYLDASFRPDGQVGSPGEASAVPADVLGGGPLIDTRPGAPASYQLPPKTIVLTFDDGPDPRWTPEVLDVLAENDVPATFFVVGSQVARYPDLVRDEAAAGHDLGTHTFTHADMAEIPARQRSLEYTQTQLALAAAAGIKTPLLRFPYSSGADSLDNETWPLVQEAGRDDYIVVTSTQDSRDWERPGVDAIVRASLPADDASAVLLLHDAGGDRAQTIAALRIVIPQLKERGYEFLTVTQALARIRPDAPTMTPASSIEVWRGRFLIWTVTVGDQLLAWLAAAMLLVGLLTAARILVMLVAAGAHARRRRSRRWSWGPPVTSPVSVIVPAFNEQENIEATVRSLTESDYPALEVVVVDDGSTDATAAIVAGLGLPQVRLVRIPNGGKANALNVGLAHAAHDLVVLVDGDTVFERATLRALVQPFADPRVGAVAGNVKVSDRRGLVGRWQHIEYVMGFNLDRRLFELARCMPTIPGAIGAFRRSAVQQAGGVRDRTLAEDTDLTMAVTRAGWRVVFEEKARAWTEAPVTLGQLCRQRFRWSYGTMQAMWAHRAALRESGPSGRFGRFGLPMIALFGVVLPLLAPVIDILMLYGVLVQGRREALYGWCGMLGLQVVTAVVAFRLDRESLRPLWTLPLQQFVYRQLIYVILVRAAAAALTGVLVRWQKLHRTGAAAAWIADHAPSPVDPAEPTPTTAAVATASSPARDQGAGSTHSGGAHAEPGIVSGAATGAAPKPKPSVVLTR